YGRLKRCRPYRWSIRLIGEIQSPAVVRFPWEVTKLRRKCYCIAAGRWTTKDSVIRLEIDPPPVVGPTRYKHIWKVGDQLARQALRDIHHVHLGMTRTSRVKSNFLAIRGPAAVICIGSPAIRHLDEVSSVRVAHPNFPGSPATGHKGDVLSIRRVLRCILATCGGNEVHGGSFRVQQISAPNLDVAEGMEDKSELVTLRGKSEVARVLSERKLAKRSVCERDFVEFGFSSDP